MKKSGASAAFLLKVGRIGGAGEPLLRGMRQAHLTRAKSMRWGRWELLG